MMDFLKATAVFFTVFTMMAVIGPRTPAADIPETDRPVHYVTLLYGTGTDRNLSELVTRPFSPAPTSDRIALLAFGRELHRTFDERLAFEIEGLYAYHWPNGHFHEVGVTLNSRWHDFPWNDRLPTTFAIGVGPSYATKIPPIEASKGHRSKLLNQFNVEITTDLTDRRTTDSNLAFVARLQHRSGIFGLINGVHGGSDFLTAGFKWRFGGGR